MSEKVMRRLAKPMLFTAAFIWGSSFFVMKDALDALPVQYLLAIRFTMGTVLLVLVCWKKWKTFTPGGSHNRRLPICGLYHPDLWSCVDNAVEKRVSHGGLLRIGAISVLAAGRSAAGPL